ncbi:MAG: hypothetical protein SFV54_06940 [Bryobacteraceae bacterium]|nr:hypothetical protein [Bryobacteraceae bacterium]
MSTAPRPLRFGVMCKAAGLSDFARRSIAELTRDRLAEPVVLIIDEFVEQPSSLAAKLRKSIRLDGNLWHLQSKLFPPSQIPAYRTQSLDECFAHLPRLQCRPTLKGKWSQYFAPEDISAIRTHNLDFILKFAFGIIRGDILAAARLGVWSFHHDDELLYRGGPPAFWEIQRGDPVTAAILQRLTDRLDGGVVLEKCHAPTDGRSYRRNLQRILESSIPLVRWACLDALAGRLEAFEAPPSKTTAPIYRAPNDAQMVAFWLRLVRNWIDYRLTNQRIDEWNVGFVPHPQSAFLAPQLPAIEWSAYREPGQMVADPFLLPVDGSPRILVEELNWTLERGRMSELRRSSPTAPFDTVTPLIQEPFHLSYPFAFLHEGDVYAIPETCEARSIVIYRLDRGRGAWQRAGTLLDDIDAVDATLYYDGVTWWLLHSGTEGARAWSLYLWHAPSLLGPWTPHVANPVKVDVGSTRPAGNLFLHEGRLYRPAQDCRRHYGAALCLMRVEELSTTAYRETLARRIEPDPTGPYPDGFHTLSGFGNCTVVDGKKHTWPLEVLARRLARRKLHTTAPPYRYERITLAPPLQEGKQLLADE